MVVGGRALGVEAAVRQVTGLSAAALVADVGRRAVAIADTFGSSLNCVINFPQ